MLPITLVRSIRGANGRNWPGIVVLDPDAPQPAAVWAQEAWEAMWMLNPINLVRRIVSRSAQRDLEIMGHEVEVQAAILIYGDDEGPRRAAEAAAMKRGYGGLFDGMTQAQVEAAMGRQAPKARGWASRRERAVRRYA